MAPSNFEFLKGNIEIIILNSLYSGDKYGYEIAKEIKDKTENAYEIKQPTLYAYLKRLEQGELIEAYWGEESSGGRRKYYRLTSEGRKASVEFTSEWKYQQSVINSLVPDDEDIQPITQESATPLFGTKTKKAKKRFIPDAAEQEEVSAKLEELLSKSEPTLQNDVVTSSDVEIISSSVIEEAEGQIEFEYPSAPEKIESQDSQTATNENPEPIENKPTYIPEQIPYETPSQPKTEYTYHSEPESREEFLRVFNSRAQEIIEKSSTETEPENQSNFNPVFDTPDSVVDKQTSDAAQGGALQDVADKLLAQGVKVRLYSNDTAKYVPQPMLYSNKIRCVVSWLTYFTFAALVFICWFSFKAYLDAQTPAVLLNYNVLVSYLLIALIFPITFTVLFFTNKTKKTKPKFDFKYHLVNTLIATGLLVILIFSLNILLLKIVFSDVVSVLYQIVIPILVAVDIPMFTVYYKAVYNKMLV